jgi:hypothetical protein
LYWQEKLAKWTHASGAAPDLSRCGTATRDPKRPIGVGGNAACADREPEHVTLPATSGYAFANLGSPAPDFLRMALQLGAAHCLRKPFTPGALLAMVNECLAEAGVGGRESGAAALRRHRGAHR